MENGGNGSDYVSYELINGVGHVVTMGHLILFSGNRSGGMMDCSGWVMGSGCTGTLYCTTQERHDGDRLL